MRGVVCQHVCKLFACSHPVGISLRLVCSSPLPSRLSTKFMSRHQKYTYHSDLDAWHAIVNLHKLACVTITPRLVQQPAIAVRHVCGCRLAISHAFRETPVPATAFEHSRWPSFETLSRSRLPVGRELFDTGTRLAYFHQQTTTGSSAPEAHRYVRLTTPTLHLSVSGPSQ